MAPAQPDPAALAFPFIGGRACLNFVATLGKRHGTPVERLPDTEALSRWFEEAGLRTDERPRVTAGDLSGARTLREAIHRLLHSARNEDAPAPDPADVTTVNTWAARPDLAPQLTEHGTGPLHWRADHPTHAALATVARDAAQLLSSPLLGRVKECENPDCSLLFLDDSQARRRRWCSMDRCGNLAKVAGYRSRGRAASTR